MCELGGRSQSFGETNVSVFRVEDGDNTFLQNVGYLPTSAQGFMTQKTKINITAVRISNLKYYCNCQIKCVYYVGTVCEI